MFVNELRLTIATQKQRKIIEPGDDALQLDTLDQKHRHWGLLAAEGIEEEILEIIVILIGHFGLLFLGGSVRRLCWHACAKTQANFDTDRND
jgi:hypothetical protein